MNATATATLLENPPLPSEGSSHEIVVDCLAGTARPRWNLIEPSFYRGLAGLEGILTVAPLFHVKPDASFSLSIKLRGAVFAAQFPDTSFHVTHPTLRPVTFVWKDRRHVQASWKGPVRAMDDWGRWVYRFYVQEDENPGLPQPPQPVYLAFTCLAEESKPNLFARLTPDQPAQSPALVGAIPASEGKLSIGIELSSEGEPVFRDLFRYGDDVALPDGVYLEPLIVVRQPEKMVDIEFTTGGTILFAGEADECDPGMANQNPLALLWRGVTDPKEGCGGADRTSARGFQSSWCNPEGGSATVRWMEPPKDEV
ncbi:MAG TPA: hypothetical protein VGG06_36285, partial [Thermoanaerobaculia bacterium]